MFPQGKFVGGCHKILYFANSNYKFVTIVKFENPQTLGFSTLRALLKVLIWPLLAPPDSVPQRRPHNVMPKRFKMSAMPK